MSQIPPVDRNQHCQLPVSRGQISRPPAESDLAPALPAPLLKAQDYLRTCGRPPLWLQGEQKQRAEQLTSYFENSTLELQYDYIENIGDGRGYTAGRAGFTTRTGDFLLVVEDYSRSQPINPLHPHLPRLRQLAQANSSSTAGLPGIVKHWQKASRDPKFRQVQDAVVDRLYFEPAMRKADELGLKLPLSRAVLYDTIIQHGNGDDPDGLPAICQRTNQQCQGADEKQWLGQFLSNRREVLLNPADTESQAAWSESVSRVDAFRQIASAENYGLEGPIHINLPEENLVFDVP